MSGARDRVLRLPCWRGPIDAQPIDGGITNFNFKVTDRGDAYVVRIGDDIPVHQVMRFNELAASRAAHAAGLSPEIVYAEPGAIVMRFVDGRTLGADDLRSPGMIERVVALLRTCHRDVALHLRGPALAFWVFHVIRNYAHLLSDGGSPHLGEVGRLLAIAGTLEREVGAAVTVFGHNDLLASNLIDDGERLWLIDWDYAGFNSPLFDLANLASNNAFDVSDERHLLELYFGASPDDQLLRRFAAMKCASLLRETMWSMVSELHSSIDFDYRAYTRDNLDRFERAYEIFTNEHRCT